MKLLAVRVGVQIQAAWLSRPRQLCADLTTSLYPSLEAPLSLRCGTEAVVVVVCVCVRARMCVEGSPLLTPFSPKSHLQSPTADLCLHHWKSCAGQ